MTTNEIYPIHWKNKIICNECPKFNSCDAVVEWFDPEYVITTYIVGVGWRDRYGPKDNKCPYEKTLDK